MDLDADLSRCLRDPLTFGKVCWPEVEFYRQQREIIRSVVENDETICVAGNMLGAWPPPG